MSRPRYGWWGYVKSMIRKYPERRGKALTSVALQEYEAVRAAIEQTERMRGGHDRLRVVELVYWKRVKCNIAGAALQIPCSEKTAQRWHGDFIRAVAQNFGLLD